MQLRASLASCILILGLSLICTAHVAQHPTLSHVRRQYDHTELHIDEDEEAHAREFFKFVTRPEIHAPRWNIKVYDKDALGPGYWFTAPYENMDQREDERRRWVGPHIYDQAGELIWSGSPMFRGWVVSDFRAATINGVDVLTGVWSSEEVNFALNSSYGFHARVEVGDGAAHQNIHDWNVVRDGKHAIAMTSETDRASREESDSVHFDGLCQVHYPGFEEYDTNTWEMTFKWTPKDHIHLKDVFVGNDCGHNWDYIHGNSVDKFQDGDFLYSGRFTDSLYKISARDGTIVWQLARRPEDSDFDFDGHFSGQHHARIVHENDTHTIISLMDNAIRPGSQHTTNDHSRGMTICLDNIDRKAEVLQTFDHPHGNYSRGRGSMQVLDNGNAFAGWWWRSLQSEYTPDGKLIMEAETVPELKAYRSYKFPWVGRPAQPPDVLAVASSHVNGTTTSIFVSWNGATDVHTWNVWQGSADGEPKQLVASAPRTGFETAFSFDGFAQHVVLEALDHSGIHLGESSVVQTIALDDAKSIQPPSDKLEDYVTTDKLNSPLSMLDDTTETYLFGFVMCATVALVIWLLWRLRKRKGGLTWWRQLPNQEKHRYEPVSNQGDG